MHLGRTRQLHLVAIGVQAGPVGLAARFALGDCIDKAAIDMKGFDFDYVDRLEHPMLLPSILRYGGMDAMWMLNRPLNTTEISQPCVVLEVLKS